MWLNLKKRGLPHAHILLVLHQESRLRTTEDIDAIVCAELPSDPAIFSVGSEMHNQATRLQNIVLSQMRHGPCGINYPQSPCMIDKNGEKSSKCQKRFPKAFQQHTEWNRNDTYPKYRRRSPEDGGRAIDTPTGPVDNGWIVPYSPYLCLKYNVHINVEVLILLHKF